MLRKMICLYSTEVAEQNLCQTKHIFKVGVVVTMDKIAPTQI